MLHPRCHAVEIFHQDEVNLTNVVLDILGRHVVEKSLRKRIVVQNHVERVHETTEVLPFEDQYDQVLSATASGTGTLAKEEHT